MLRAGGTMRHKELLAPFGLDASDPAFWAKGLGVIARLHRRIGSAGVNDVLNRALMMVSCNLHVSGWCVEPASDAASAPLA